MPNHELQVAFEECLERLENGASLDECLAIHPELANQLAPMLTSITLLKGTPKSIPTPNQIEDMRLDFLQRVPRQKRGISLPRGAAVVGVTVTILFALSALFVFASQQDSNVGSVDRIPTAITSNATSPTNTPTSTVDMSATETTLPTVSVTEVSAISSPEMSTLDSVMVVTAPLWAGQTINAGQIMISYDDVNLYVTYQPSSDWLLEQTHVDIRSEVPVNANELAPGQFNYKTEAHNPAVAEFTYTIPLSELEQSQINSPLVVLAHASVRGVGNRSGESESAWGGNITGEARRWFYYSLVTLNE